MGARVKKTVRERLEEMRNVESTGTTEDLRHENGDHQAYHSSSRFVYNKRRKIASNQQHQEGVYFLFYSIRIPYISL